VTITFTIHGKPYAKKRPRFSRKIGRAFDPAENATAERTIAAIASPLFPAPIVGPVSIEIIATFATAASWSKAKTAALIHRPHTQKPDADNLAKWVLDGLNRIAWGDDGQVSQITIRKVWGLQNQTVVHVTAAREGN